MAQQSNAVLGKPKQRPLRGKREKVMAGNARSGRPRKAAARHRLEGTFREDRHGGRSPDDTVSGGNLPRPPTGLTGEAKKLWEAIVLPLVTLAGAGELDVPALCGMCRWFDLWAQTDKLLKKLPGNPKLAALARLYWNEFDKMAARFGMTPADRQRLRPPEAEKKKGVIGQLLRDRFAGEG